MNKLIWRIRFTIYGQRKTRWGWLLWWEWSDSAADDFYDDALGFSDHKHAVRENIYDAFR